VCVEAGGRSHLLLARGGGGVRLLDQRHALALDVALEHLRHRQQPARDTRAAEQAEHARHVLLLVVRQERAAAAVLLLQELLHVRRWSSKAELAVVATWSNQLRTDVRSPV
jgi:hypothetical protein